MISFETSKRKKILNLQLAPMIDVFTLIIVFLLMSTVMGQASVEIPPGLKNPKSVSKETLDVAPQVIIHQEKVILPVLALELPLKQFMDGLEPKEMADLKAKVGAYIKNTADKNKGAVVNINVVAGHATPYPQIFNVVKVLRAAGFQSVLFVAESEAAQAQQQGAAGK